MSNRDSARHLPMKGATALRIRVPTDWPDAILCSPVRPVREDEFGEVLAARLEEAIVGIEGDGVGLAAPQVDDPRAWIVLRVEADDHDGFEPIHRAMVNPRMSVVDGTQAEGRESCLSFPGIRVPVSRFRAVEVTWQDPRDGSTKTERFEDFAARVVQHEIDHLDGRTVLHRTNRDTRRDWLAMQAKKARAEGPRRAW